MSYQFVLSLPERLVRSLSALTGGLLREVGVVLLPARIRRTALYRVMVEVTLRFLIEELGRVKGVYTKSQDLEDFLLKRTASHGIELLGLLTLHVSPIWVLAALADATGAGHALIEQIAESLKDEGLLERNASFKTLDQLLGGLERTSAHLARYAQYAARHVGRSTTRMATAEGSAAERAAGESAELGYTREPLEQTAGSIVRRTPVGLRSVLHAGCWCAGRTAV